MALRTIFYVVLAGLILHAIFSQDADASSGKYEPAPKAPIVAEIPKPPTIGSAMAGIADTCLKYEQIILSMTGSDGKTVYHTFLCQYKFTSEKPPGGIK